TFLECVGFHGNSCPIIFAATQVRLPSSRPSARILFAGTSVKPAKENGLESLQLTALPHPNMRLILPSGDMPGRPAAVTAAARRRAPARRAAWRARAACIGRGVRRAGG